MSHINQNENDVCAICLDSMDAKGGRALFTAECSHTFHFECIVSNVQHGNRTCPLCLATWRRIPFASSPQSQHHYSDDEPVAQQSQRANTVPCDGKVDIKTFLEFPAVKKSASFEDFSVLIHLKAPSLPVSDSARAAVDIVAVLDISGSMAGSKLSLLKQAMNFVIQNLSSQDRLSIITFSSNARRILRLVRMTESGQLHAYQAVNSLVEEDCTDIAAGLTMGAKVLEDRQHKNPVCSIIFLSDGQDNVQLSRAMANPSRPNSYMSLLPSSIVGGEVGRRIPVHAFGFGTDHDAALMHSIAEASGGTFSFVEAPEMIQDAFAQCIGGLLTVVAQDVQVEVKCLHPEIHINSISSGSYRNQVADAGKRGLIQFGNLYASEERDFLVSINLNAGVESALLNVSCTYKEPVSMNTIRSDDKAVSVPRPEEVKPEERLVSPEVERHKKRFEAVATVASAQAAADGGNLSEAISILGNFRGGLASNGPLQDAMQVSLDMQMGEMQTRLSSRSMYMGTGRAYMMSCNMSNFQQRASARSNMSNFQQRASARSTRTSTSVYARAAPERHQSPVLGFAGMDRMCGSRIAEDYQTTAMFEMIDRSRAQRAQGGDLSSQDPPPQPAPPNSEN